MSDHDSADHDFPDADLSDSDLCDIEFADASFSDADFSRADFSRADFPGADFSRVDSPYAAFPDAAFPDTAFPDTDLPDADIPDADFPDADFPDADFPSTDYPYADFPDTDFPDTDICGIDAHLPLREHRARLARSAAKYTGSAESSKHQAEAVRNAYSSAHYWIGQGEAIKLHALAHAYDLAETLAEGDLEVSPSAESFLSNRDRRFAWHLRSLMGEISFVTRETDNALRNRAYDAHTLVHEYPDWVEAIAAAKIELRHAREMLKAVGSLGAAEAETLAERALEYASDHSVNETRKYIDRQVATLAAKTFEEVHARERAERNVTVKPALYGMAHLIAYLPLEQATAIEQILTLEARAIREDNTREHDAVRARRREASHANRDSETHGECAASRAGSTGGTRAAHGTGAAHDIGTRDSTGAAHDIGAPYSTGEADATSTAGEVGEEYLPDDRTTAQIRADIFAETLLTATPESILTSSTAGAARITATVNVTVPVLTLASGRLDETDPALLNGTAPMSFEEARQFASTAPTLQRVLTHPITGHTICVDDYTPDKSLRRFLQVRDAKCRFPGCARPASESDLDHTVPFSEGGPTHVENLAHLCRAHHVQKHHAGWGVRQLGRGVLEFTTPLGHSVRNEPERTGPRFRPTDEHRDEPPPF